MKMHPGRPGRLRGQLRGGAYKKPPRGHECPQARLVHSLGFSAALAGADAERVAVLVGEGECVAVRVAVGVRVGVRVGVILCVAVRVYDCQCVKEPVPVGTAVNDADGDDVLLGVTAAVAVGSDVPVTVGVGEAT